MNVNPAATMNPNGCRRRSRERPLHKCCKQPGQLQASGFVGLGRHSGIVKAQKPPPQRLRHLPSLSWRQSSGYLLQVQRQDIDPRRQCVRVRHRMPFTSTVPARRSVGHRSGRRHPPNWGTHYFGCRGATHFGAAGALSPPRARSLPGRSLPQACYRPSPVARANLPVSPTAPPARHQPRARAARPALQLAVRNQVCRLLRRLWRTSGIKA